MQQEDANKFDPGPSGTAIAGLIIALAALAVALYGVLQPQQKPVKATEQMVGEAVKAEVDRRMADFVGKLEAASQSAARTELSRAYIVPSPGPDPGSEPASNVIKLEERKSWSFQRIE